MVVVVVGGCPTPCKKGGGIVRAGKYPWGNMSGENMSRGNVRIPTAEASPIRTLAIRV